MCKSDMQLMQIGFEIRIHDYGFLISCLPPAIALALGSLLLTACGDHHPAAPRASKVPAVRVATVQRVQFDRTLTVSATLQGIHTATIMPRVAGRVQAVHVRMGDHVKRGQRLLSLVPVDYRQVVLQAQAAHAITRAQLARTLSSHGRVSKLHRVGAATRAELEGTDTALRVARAALRQSSAGLSAARTRLGDTRVRAPFAGVITARNIEPGEIIGPSVRRPPLRLVDLSSVRVVAHIGELRAGRVHAGQHAVLAVDAIPGRSFAARIQRVNQELDPVTRTVEIHAVLKNPGGLLRHGMAGKLQISQAAGEPSLAVPRGALLERDDGQARVLVLLPGQTVRSTRVRYGRSSGELVKIRGGLSKGSEVVVAGHTLLADGTRVHVLRASIKRRGERSRSSK